MLAEITRQDTITCRDAEIVQVCHVYLNNSFGQALMILCCSLTNRMRLVRLAIPFQEGLQDDVLRHCHTDLQQGVSMQAHRELIAVRDALRTISVKYLTK